MLKDMKLGKYVLYLGDEEIEIGLDDLIPIGDDLSAEFTDQPSLYAYIAMLAARTEAEWLDSKNALAEMRAVTDKAVRQDLEASNVKVTEGKVSAEVELRRGYRDAVDGELDCREQHLIMRALTQAMDMRAQMLISLGAHLRAEASQTGMYIKKKLDDVTKSQKKTKPKRNIPVPVYNEDDIPF